MQITIVLPSLPKSWNTFVSKQSFWVYKQYKDEIHWTVKAAFNKKYRGVSLSPPVTVAFVYGFTDNRRRDIDSMCIKPHVDALVACNLLPDDHKEIIPKVTHTWQKTPSPQTKITIKES